MTKGRAAFVDTTIHVDRVLRKQDTQYIKGVDQICAGYDARITSTFSKLEFKNVVLMDLQCVAQWIEEEDSFVAAYGRAMQVQSRRSKTLANIAAFVQRGVDTSIEVKKGDSLDAQLKEQALTFIYNAIEYLWLRFDHEVDSVVDNTECRRVREAPERQESGKVTVRNQRSQCRSMACNNVGVYVAQMPRLRRLVEKLRKMEASGDDRMTAELREIVSTYDFVASNRNRLFDFNRCVGLGDLWIHLEAVQTGAEAMITRNYKESTVLCESLNLAMVDPSKTKPSEGNES
jgi:hypothetical protein